MQSITSLWEKNINKKGVIYYENTINNSHHFHPLLSIITDCLQRKEKLRNRKYTEYDCRT